MVWVVSIGYAVLFGSVLMGMLGTGTVHVPVHPRGQSLLRWLGGVLRLGGYADATLCPGQWGPTSLSSHRVDPLAAGADALSRAPRPETSRMSQFASSRAVVKARGAWPPDP